MRRSLVWMSVWLVLVPILGLSSCSKKQDDWKMTEPTVVGLGITPMGVRFAGSRTLPADAALDLTGSSFSTVSIHSACRTDSSAAPIEADFSTAAHSKLPLKQLWPEALWSKMTAAQLAASVCDFQFIAANDLGSTSDFELRDVKLASFAGSQRSNTLTSQALSVPAARTLVGDLDQLSLVCGDQRAKLNLEHGLVAPEFASTLKSQLDLRGVQRCHFVASAKVIPPAIAAYEITDDMDVHFASAPLFMTHLIDHSHVDPNNLLSETLDRYELANSSDSPAYVSILTAPASSFVKYVFADQGQGGAGVFLSKVSHPSLAHSTVTSATLIETSATEQTYEIAAHSSAFVALQLVSVANVVSYGPCTAASAYTPIIGFQFELAQALVVSQRDSANGENVPLISFDRSLASRVYKPLGESFDAQFERNDLQTNFAANTCQ